jgi:hypothetical protein
MIFGKIDPVATIVKDSKPFSQTTVTGSYFTAVANPYILGSEEVNFALYYGNCTFDTGSGAVKKFETIYRGILKVSGSAISNWGTNDDEVLNAIALLQGTTVTEIVSGSIKLPL